MNLELSKEKIFNILKSKNYNISPDIFMNQLISTFERTDIILKNLYNNNLSGLERNDEFGLTNPLLWEFGHILFFWEHMTMKYIDNNNLIAKKEIYDSFRIKRDYRFKINLLKINEIRDRLNNIKSFCLKKIAKRLQDPVLNYLIRISHLHHEMHNESFLFTQQLLDLKLYNITDNDSLLLNNIDMIKINGGEFFQGANNNEFSFDNELPSFKINIKSFNVSKYCITNYQYLKFIEAGGYNNKDYWLPEGWLWKEENNITEPLYWKIINNNWHEKVWGNYIPIRLNNPVIHISWYEARAFCSWKKSRLLTESEWEYLSYKDINYKIKSNLDYTKGSTISVLKDKNINSNGLVGLFGNCWEWCEDPIYPYDGYKIDPVYREMSYPFFGYKRICRGGAWCVPSFLITKSYRNAQSPECRYQYIGFRIAS